MKTELARVVNILDDSMAEVEIRVEPADCDACRGGCHTCAAASSIRMKARNEIGAAVGEKVMVDGKTGASVCAVLLVLFLPVILALAGYSLWEPWGSVLGVPGLPLALAVNHFTAASRIAQIRSRADNNQ